MKITKRQLKRIIKEEKARLAEYGLAHSEKGLTRPGSDVNLEPATEKIEAILNDLWDQGVDNDGLKQLLRMVIEDIDAGFVGEPT